MRRHKQLSSWTMLRGQGYILLALLALSLFGVGIAQATPTSPVDQTQVPHYYGPSPNWVNSPMPLSTATVLIIDATGLNAAAVAQVGANGAVTDIFVTNGGAGYSATPTVVIQGTTGSGATASATVVEGVIKFITVTAPGSGYITSGGIRKFVDPLPLTCDPATGCPATSKYIPLAVPTVRNYAGVPTDEYTIGVVQYKTSFSSSLPDTMVRTFVQLDTGGIAGSQHVALSNTLVDGTVIPISGYFGVTSPQWFGPVILATRNRPVRVIFRNLLPTGAAGDLFLPTDSTMMGSGMGPTMMADPMNLGSVTDMARNPMCSQYPKPASCFKDNRATLHLHGGLTPWISDGTVHQWTAPAGEVPYPDGTGARVNKGDGVRYVPDMWFTSTGDFIPACAGLMTCSEIGATNDPGPGAMTFFYTNQQSARFLWYHDHAWGITRLNVLAGEAAGYLITDPTEQALIAAGTIPGPADTIPLVVQDKTFVPTDAQLYGNPAGGIYGQDPTWDKTRWGGYGNLWYHHVYMPAENPGDASGMSGYGRWFYGPWFWPPALNLKYPPIRNPYYNMNPATNFTTALATPCDIDIPSTWQYQTDPYCEPEWIPGTPNISVGMEQFNDTPTVNGVAYPTVTLQPKPYRLRIINAANDRFFNLQWYIGEAATASTALNSQSEPIGPTEVTLNPADLLLAQVDPAVSPTALQWGATTNGPDWIQVANESGFLPAPAIINGHQVTTYITDPTRFDVGNVNEHSLLIAPAERADVIVDFSAFAGKTLILYNDAPAAVPARIATYDYYTGQPDMSPAGAPAVLPGFGPNTRTIMQVKIAGAPAAEYNLTNLQTAFGHHLVGGVPAGVFESGQHPIIVGQAAYNSAYGTAFSTSSWCNAPGTTKTKCDGFARIHEQGGDLFGFNTLLAPLARMQIPIQPKAIHDEMNAASFDEFGRMTANLGLEAVPATAMGQSIVLYPFVNPPTELIDGTGLPAANVTVTPISRASDGTQIWKFTHNGVDTHPIHFHLFDVQLINRVTWDNIIIPPDANELGWKDTVRMAPLEDTIVALRPVLPVLPFEMPNSIRRLDPMMMMGSNLGFNNVDSNNNPTTPIINKLVNFGSEYIYHCHILSHEEMDMMRPIALALPPIAPSGLTFDTSKKRLSWEDNSITETGFAIQRRNKGSTVWKNIGRVISPLDMPNTHGTRTYRDRHFSPGATYRVAAQNTVGYGLGFPVLTVISTSSSLTVFSAKVQVASTTAMEPKTPSAGATNVASTDTGGCSATSAAGTLSQALSVSVAFFIIGMVGLVVKRRATKKQ